MREVITIQVGTQANYVGAHFWNFQDELQGLDPTTPEGAHVGEIDSDVLHRVGETRQGVTTYTPRLLVFDIKGSLGAMRAVGSLYDPTPSADVSTVATWNGGKAVHKQKTEEKNEFQQLLDDESEPSTPGHALNLKPTIENDLLEVGDRKAVESLESKVSYWTDFLKAHLHPKSVVELKSDWMDGEDGMSLQSYGHGLSLTVGGEAQEEASEKLRFFAEESDHLQGFQCVMDNSGGFSALGCEILGQMVDEFPRLPRWVTSVQIPQPETNEKTLERQLSSSFSFASVALLADLYVPLGRQSLTESHFPHLTLDDSKAYHTSAVYATALDTATLPYRMAPHGPMHSNSNSAPVGGCDMASMVRLLAQQSYSRVACCALGFPASGVSLDQASRSSTSSATLNLRPLTPYVANQQPQSLQAEAVVWRGARMEGAGGLALLPLAQRALEMSILKEKSGLCIRHLCLTRQPLAVPLPFPFIFKGNVSKVGEVLCSHELTHTLKGGLEVSSVPVLTRLTTGSPVVPLLKQRLEILKKLSTKKCSVGSGLLAQWGITGDERDDAVEFMEKLIAGSGGTTFYGGD